MALNGTLCIKMETNAKIIIGILGVLLVLTNGAQYYLEPTGKELRCTTGWTFQEIGEYEGQYMCKTATTLRYSYCSSTRDTMTGRINYYCTEAVPILIEPDKEEQSTSTNTGVKTYLCHSNNTCHEINDK